MTFKGFFLESHCNTHQVGYWVSKLCVELIDKTLDEPVTVDRIIYDLLHGSTDGEEVLVLFILRQHVNNVTEPKNKENREIQVLATWNGRCKWCLITTFTEHNYINCHRNQMSCSVPCIWSNFIWSPISLNVWMIHYMKKCKYEWHKNSSIFFFFKAQCLMDHSHFDPKTFHLGLHLYQNTTVLYEALNLRLFNTYLRSIFTKYMADFGTYHHYRWA